MGQLITICLHDTKSFIRSLNRSRLFSKCDLVPSVSDTVPHSSMTMFLRITSILSYAAGFQWWLGSSYRTHLGSRSWQKLLQSQAFPAVLAIHSRSAQDCSYAGMSSLWPCALPIELSWDSAPEQSCSTKGQDLKQVLAFGLVMCVTFSVPIPANKMGSHRASEGFISTY